MPQNVVASLTYIQMITPCLTCNQGKKELNLSFWIHVLAMRVVRRYIASSLPQRKGNILWGNIFLRDILTASKHMKTSKLFLFRFFGLNIFLQLNLKSAFKIK